MISFLILITSFIIAAVGLIQSNKARQTKRTILGLTKLGLSLLVAATIGFVASVAKEVTDSRESARLRQQSAEDTMLLKTVNAKVDYLIGATSDPAVVEGLQKLKDYMNLAASRSRATNFSLSDFSLSRFDKGNFTQCYFPGALFKDAGFDDAHFDGSNFERAVFSGSYMKSADFRGVDLSEIVIDEGTILPTR